MADQRSRLLISTSWAGRPLDLPTAGRFTLVFMKIGDAARAAGLTAKQVRFYDETGVIRRPQRAANGYRDFTPAEVERLVLVRRLRALDLPLDEIREIVAFCFEGRCDLMNERLREVLSVRRAEVDQRRRELDRLAGQFDDLLDRLGAAELRPTEV